MLCLSWVADTMVVHLCACRRTATKQVLPNAMHRTHLVGKEVDGSGRGKKVEEEEEGRM